MKHIKKNKYKYINGINGIISIFLCILLTPFLTLAGILVESSRYQSVYELLEQITSSAGLSTLAEYDEYLDERFGLQAVSQGNGDINSIFKKYIDANQSVIGGNVSLKDQISAEGKYSLYDLDILKQQVMDYSETTVLTKIADDMFDFDKLINNFAEYLGLNDKICDGLTGFLNSVDDVTDVAKNVKSVVEDVIKLKDKASDVVKSIESIKKKNYLEAIKNEIRDLKSKFISLDKDDINNVSDDEIKSEVGSLKSKISDYHSDVTNLITTLNDFVKDIKNIAASCQNIRDNIGTKESGKGGESSSFNTLINEIDKEFCKDSTSKLSNNIINSVLNVIDNRLRSDDIIDDLKSISWDAYKAEKDGNDKFSIDNELVKVKLEISFDYLENIVNGIGISAESFKESKGEDDSKNLFKSLGDLFTKISGIESSYVKGLDAVLEDGFVYENFGAENKIKDGIDKIKNGMTDFNDSGWDIIKKLEGIVNIFSGISQFVVGVGEKIGQITTGIISAVTNYKELYERAILAGYMYYNLPNRINYNSSDGLTGYSYKSITKTDTDSNVINFKGAEYEYILSGTNDEKINQQLIFFDIFMIRLIMNFSPMQNDVAIQAVSNAVKAIPYIGVALSVIVKVVVLIAESYCDSLLVVNGETVPLLKNNGCYLGKNISEFIDKISAIKTINENIGTALENYKKKSEESKVRFNAAQKDDSKLEFGYGHYTILGIILTKNTETVLKRFANIVQLESNANYNLDGETFNLKNAYSYIFTNVEAELKPFFVGIKLNTKGNFNVKVVRYKGY